jgi:predicted transcriptional regulator
LKVSLSERESDVMVALWDRGPSTVAEVRERLPHDLAYTTVLTFLRILESKGYVRHEGVGRAHRYSAVIARDAARRSALRDLSTRLFGGSVALLLLHAASDARLTDAEVDRIERLIRQRAAKGKR